MKVFNECKFFATEEEARAFMAELDAKSWGYYWAEYNGIPDIEDFESGEDYLSYIAEENRYILAAMNYGLTVEEMEEKPECVLLYSEEFNTEHQAILKRMAEKK